MTRITPASLLWCVMAWQSCFATDIEFSGPTPGPAAAQIQGDELRLENNVIAGTWQLQAGTLRPGSLKNKLTGLSHTQAGTEIFRLTSTASPAGDGTFPIEINLTAERIIVRVGQDGKALTEIASFPRSDFPGEPTLIRVGKMNLKAQAKNSGGEAGPEGESKVSQIEPAPAGKKSLMFKAPANHAMTFDLPWVKGTQQVTARIDKGTDVAMSWSPAVALVWEDGKRFLSVGVRSKNGTFNVTTAASERITTPRLTEFPSGDIPASAFKVEGSPQVVRLQDGQALEAILVSPAGLRVKWRAELRDGSHYFRQSVELTSPRQVKQVYGVEFTDLQLPRLLTVGTVPGCPVAGSGFFAGVEMPGSSNQVSADGARIAFSCVLELTPTQSYRFSSVTGIAPEGQLRRAFLRYIERERARPSQPFLHYNCWYDLGFGVDEAKMVDVVKSFDRELVRQRHVPVQGYLVDDGWDNPGKGLWVENAQKFPTGLPGTKAKFAPYDAHLALWISPMGGYGGDKERTAHAQKMGLLPPGQKLDLSFPKYRQWFEGRCLQLMRESGVNCFKWDRAGENVSPHFMALLEIARNLRRENPAVFINVTVGTWPSPFWLNHIDTTWRNGSSDVGWAGKGDDREKWLTFRDGYCLKLFVQASPLYPLNSVMHHGIVHGRAFQGEKVGKAGNDLKNEARSYFANGASLQELYLTPSMMTPTAWDQVAESAQWAHAHAEVLRDAHWVGGDPLKLEPYGYAAWNPREVTLMLRNPDDQPRTIELEAGTVFDLPAGNAHPVSLRAAYRDQRMASLSLIPGQKTTVTLQPFEVLVFDTAKAR